MSQAAGEGAGGSSGGPPSKADRVCTHCRALLPEGKDCIAYNCKCKSLRHSCGMCAVQMLLTEGLICRYCGQRPKTVDMFRTDSDSGMATRASSGHSQPFLQEEKKTEITPKQDLFCDPSKDQLLAMDPLERYAHRAITASSTLCYWYFLCLMVGKHAPPPASPTRPTPTKSRRRCTHYWSLSQQTLENNWQFHYFRS